MRISEITMAEPRLVARIHALAQASYALEAEWIGRKDFPPLRETAEELGRCGDRFLVCQRSGEPVGALSFDGGVDPVVISRLVVSPSFLRQGIATALLRELERRLPPGTGLAVSTAADNAPAVRLYRRLGYAVDRTSRALEGIALVHLSKQTAAG